MYPKEISPINTEFNKEVKKKLLREWESEINRQTFQDHNTNLEKEKRHCSRK